MPCVILKPGHVQPVWAGHPWVYAQAIERAEGNPVSGDEVDVQDPRGNFLGRGLYSPTSAIPVRLYTRIATERIDEQLFTRRIAHAVARRARVLLPSVETNAWRAVHAEGDDLPGLIVDAYDDVAVMQIGTVGLKRREAQILNALESCLHPRAIIDRTSERAARSEGFEAGRGVLRGDTSVDRLLFTERGLTFRIPLSIGQKTGFYLDQRSARARLEELSPGARVLDAFSFVGAASLSAARGGAREVLAVDSSPLALEVAAECAGLNGLSERIRFERGEAFEALKSAGSSGGFDLVVCDPPKLAPTRGALKAAMRTMRKIASLACRATRPETGRLMLSSCSAALGLTELMRSLALGATDVNLRAVVLERLFQGPDHPVPAGFVEGQYLSTVLVEVNPP